MRSNPSASKLDQNIISDIAHSTTIAPNICAGNQEGTSLSQLVCSAQIYLLLEQETLQNEGNCTFPGWPGRKSN
jgi:hypothetical protein